LESRSTFQAGLFSSGGSIEQDLSPDLSNLWISSRIPSMLPLSSSHIGNMS
jgi:hypothetical protein